jgi:hypothetical protein
MRGMVTLFKEYEVVRDYLVQSEQRSPRDEVG